MTNGPDDPQTPRSSSQTPSQGTAQVPSGQPGTSAVSSTTASTARAIGSSNSLRALETVYQRLQNGEDSLDAVVAGTTLVEDDPADLTVGYGGLPNEQGIVELDAAVMHGPTHRIGAVAGLRTIRHATQVAQLVLQQTDNHLLVGQGALEFALANGFQPEDLLTEHARRLWMYWRRIRSNIDDWLTPAPDEPTDPAVAVWFAKHLYREPGSGASVDRPTFDRPTGTVHIAAQAADGSLSGATSTSGLAFSLSGRVGDSPIPGAGLYVDNDVGTCGATGRGEASLSNASAYAAVELMRQGVSPEQAGLEALRRVVAKTPPRLLDPQGRPRFPLRLYLLAKNGGYAGVSLWGPRSFAIADASGPRLETTSYLYQREET